MEGGGGSLKIEPLARGAAKISSFKFQYLHPLVILNELSLISLLICHTLYQRAVSANPFNEHTISIEFTISGGIAKREEKIVGN